MCECHHDCAPRPRRTTTPTSIHDTACRTHVVSTHVAHHGNQSATTHSPASLSESLDEWSGSVVAASRIARVVAHVAVMLCHQPTSRTLPRSTARLNKGSMKKGAEAVVLADVPALDVLVEGECEVERERKIGHARPRLE